MSLNRKDLLSKFLRFVFPISIVELNIQSSLVG